MARTFFNDCLRYFVDRQWRGRQVSVQDICFCYTCLQNLFNLCPCAGYSARVLNPVATAEKNISANISVQQFFKITEKIPFQNESHFKIADKQNEIDHVSCNVHEDIFFFEKGGILQMHATIKQRFLKVLSEIINCANSQRRLSKPINKISRLRFFFFKYVG